LLLLKVTHRAAAVPLFRSSLRGRLLQQGDEKKSVKKKGSIKKKGSVKKAASGKKKPK